MTKTIQRAFVSYSSSDADVAKSVADACEKAGAAVFLDQRSLQPSTAWYEALKANLADADVVFVLVSEAALKSRYVNQEIGMARQAGAKVVPLFLVPRGGLPPEIGSLHGESIVGLRGAVLDERVATLLAASERAAIDVPPVLRDRLDAHDPRTASAFVAALPVALGAPAGGAPFLLPALREHGPRHIERVLRLCAWILDEASLQRLSARDVIALTLALVLRERMLYVPLPALQVLLRRATLPPLAVAADVPVQRLWQNFVQNVRFDDGAARIDHRVLLDLALEGDAVASEAALPWLGRFVRRYQGRLAHEAAAVPPEGFLLPRVLADLLPGRLGAIVPLLTRAGDEALRAMVEGLAAGGSRPRVMDGAVPVVLAAVLRCAAHLDHFAAVSDAGLEPKLAELATDAISEPALRSISEIRYDPLTDARALQVHASPDSAFAYQAVLEWTRGLQARLDECWAVIGDIFGDGRFGLKLRTASTPLADPVRVGLDRLPYVPQLARLTTASAQLIQLLTAPLYGDRPEVGVRELLQNALDAVRERAHWPPSADEEADPRLVARSCNVLIHMSPPAADNGTGWLEVVDRGVGMTPDTVRDFFLRVGASLRQDADWMQRFPVEKQAKLLRSGRFGIGTLAAYLLGDEVQVTTRHVTETDGVGTQFVARLSDAPIELRRVPAPVGTSIRIPVSAAVYEALASQPDHWDWFALDQPSVVRVVGDVVIKAKVVESEHDLGRMPWRHLQFDDLERLLWRPGQQIAHQRLWCNGLLVEDAHETITERRYNGGGPWILDTADVMILDGRGRLALTVSRDRLAGRAPYHDALLRDFLLDHCAWLLARAAKPPAAAVPRAPMWRHCDGMWPGDGWLEAPPYMEVEGGLLPWATANIAASGIGNIVAFDGNPVVALDSPKTGYAFALLPLQIFGGFRPESRTSVATRHLGAFVRAIVPATTVDVLTRFDDDPKAFSVIGTANGMTWRSNDTRIDSVVAAPLLPLATALAERHGANVVAYATVDSGAKPRPDALARIWDELGLPAIIPRDAATRERTCGQALAALGDRVRLHMEAMGP